MHVNQIKEVVKILTSNKETNKDQQACLLGYVVGLEAPVSLNQDNDPDDQLEWNSFFKELPGEINEHFMINLAKAQEVANLTLQYRQAVVNSSDKIEQLAASFLKLTGSAFGLLGNGGIVNQIRKVLKETVNQKVAGIEERMAARREAAGREEAEGNERRSATVAS